MPIIWFVHVQPGTLGAAQSYTDQKVALVGRGVRVVVICLMRLGGSGVGGGGDASTLTP